MGSGSVSFGGGARLCSLVVHVAVVRPNFFLHFYNARTGRATATTHRVRLCKAPVIFNRRVSEGVLGLYLGGSLEVAAS